MGSRLWASTAWPAILRPLLATDQRRELSLLLHGTFDQAADSYGSTAPGPPLEDAIALQVLGPHSVGAAVTKLAYEVEDVDLDCGTDVGRMLYMTYLGLPTEGFLRDLDWRLMTAASAEGTRRFLDAARLVGYRYAWDRRANAGLPGYYGVREFERLAEWATSPRYGRCSHPWVELRDSWCAPVDAPAWRSWRHRRGSGGSC